MKKNKFQSWLGLLTCRDLGKKLGVSYMAINYWQWGKTRPRVETAAKIIKMSNGYLTWADIYGSKIK
jgi:DNA-binding XRE family transcriptional regulator